MNRRPQPVRSVAPVAGTGVATPHLLAAAEQQLSHGRVSEAAALLEVARRRTPDGPDVNALLAVVALYQGRASEAVTLAQRAVEFAPGEARHFLTLGRAHKATGALHAAAQAYRKAIELRPRFAEAHVSLGITLKALDDIDGAIACHERAIEIDPTLAAAHTNLGAALALRDERLQEGSIDGLPAPDSIGALQRAAALAPQNAVVQRNLGAILLRAGRPADAMHAFNAALTLDPHDRQACVYLGRCLVDLGEHAMATRLGEKWLAANPPDAEVLRGLVSSLCMVGEIDAALDWSGRALAFQADPMAQVVHGNALIQARRIEEGVAACRAGVDASGGDVALYPTLLMSMNYLHDRPEPLFAAHGELLQRLAPLSRPAVRRSVADGAALRVGFVSADFVSHSVAWFMEPLLRHIDPARLQVTCYHNNARSDEVTARLQACGGRWVPCAHLNDEALDRRIRADGIDLLVDLGGMTANSRMMVFACQPAPVQVGYLGYPTVSGVPGIAWRLTDEIIDPGDMPRFAGEQPLRLGRSMFCYQPPPAPPPGPPPAMHNGHVTFGSFNNIAKLTDHTLQLWAQVLHAVPGSRLLLKSTAMNQAAARSSIGALMDSVGVHADRLTLLGRQDRVEDHLALYRQVDIALDTYPYNGATTSCEALWMGTPLVTRRGATHTSRMGASILGAIGRDDWVADSDAAFVAVAAALAARPATLATWRAGARAHIADSALCDGPAMARAFERAMARAWSSGTDASAQDPSADVSATPA